MFSARQRLCGLRVLLIGLLLSLAHLACGVDAHAGPQPVISAAPRSAAVDSLLPPAAPTATELAPLASKPLRRRGAAATEPAQARVMPAPPAERDRWPRLVISEVMTDPMLLDDAAGEYLEIANVGGLAAEISELALELPSGRRVSLERPTAPLLEPCRVLLVVTLPRSDAAVTRPMRLPNRAGRLLLRWRGEVIDVAHWTGRWPWPRHRVGVALERRSVASDGTLGPSWRHAARPHLGVERGSPGQTQLGCALSAAATATAALARRR